MSVFDRTPTSQNSFPAPFHNFDFLGKILLSFIANKLLAITNDGNREVSLFIRGLVENLNQKVATTHDVSMLGFFTSRRLIRNSG